MEEKTDLMGGDRVRARGGVGIGSAAQTVDSLSPEAQRYAAQEPGEVLQKLTSQISKSPATDLTRCPVIPAGGPQPG